MKESTQALIQQHNDDTDRFLARVERATELFGDIDAYLAAGYREELQDAGLWECEHCGTPVEDPAHPDASEGCDILTDSDGIGTIILCHECHEAAVEARKKIVVETDEEYGDSEDDSALTDDEKTLASYLDRQDQGVGRQARDIISDYPRDERRTLHGYQDKIDARRRRSGKTRQ